MRVDIMHDEAPINGAVPNVQHGFWLCVSEGEFSTYYDVLYFLQTRPTARQIRAARKIFNIEKRSRLLRIKIRNLIGRIDQALNNG